MPCNYPKGIAMVTFFNFAGLIFWVSGIGACATARGAMHESTGSLMILTGTVFIVGAALLNEMRTARAKPMPDHLLGPGDKKQNDKK